MPMDGEYSGLTELLEYVCAIGLLVVEGSHVEHAIVYCKLSKSHGRQSVTGHLHGPPLPHGSGGAMQVGLYAPHWTV